VVGFVVDDATIGASRWVAAVAWAWVPTVSIYWDRLILCSADPGDYSINPLPCCLVALLHKMSKTKLKKIMKADERPEDRKGKELGEEKGDKRGAGDVKSPPASSQWTDWIWDEGLKLFYRARPEKGGVYLPVFHIRISFTLN